MNINKTNSNDLETRLRQAGDHIRTNPELHARFQPTKQTAKRAKTSPLPSPSRGLPHSSGRGLLTFLSNYPWHVVSASTVVGLILGVAYFSINQPNQLSAEELAFQNRQRWAMAQIESTLSELGRNPPEVRISLAALLNKSPVDKSLSRLFQPRTVVTIDNASTPDLSAYWKWPKVQSPDEGETR
jgi:hypothetical protein